MVQKTARRKANDPRSFDAGTPEYIKAVAARAKAHPNLVDCFIAAMAAKGHKVSHLPEYINERVKLNSAGISYSRLREWATGVRPVPEAAAKLMEQKAAAWALNEIGATGGKLPVSVLRALVTRVFPWVAKFKDGEEPVTISRQDELWLAKAMSLPVAKEATASPARKPAKKAAGKKAVAKKVTAKKVVKKAARKVVLKRVSRPAGVGAVRAQA
jgi:hypothetical protein